MSFMLLVIRFIHIGFAFHLIFKAHAIPRDTFLAKDARHEVITRSSGQCTFPKLMLSLEQMKSGLCTVIVSVFKTSLLKQWVQATYVGILHSMTSVFQTYVLLFESRLDGCCCGAFSLCMCAVNIWLPTVFTFSNHSWMAVAAYSLCMCAVNTWLPTVSRLFLYRLHTSRLT